MALSAILLLIFAVAIGWATFIENDFGSAAARTAVYNAHWFEVLLFLLCFNMFGSLFKYKVFSNRKWAILLFHLSFIIMIIGAGITRYFGYEGIMHIREGETVDYITTDKATLSVHQNAVFVLNQEVNELEGMGAMNDIQSTVNAKALQIVQTGFVYNAAKMARTNPNGKPTISFIVSDAKYQYKRVFLQSGEIMDFGGITYCLNLDSDADIRFVSIGDSLYFESKEQVFSSSMTGGNHATLSPDTTHKVIVNNIYQFGNVGFSLKYFYPNANIEVVSMQGHQGNYPLHGLKVDLKYGDETKSAYVFGGTSYSGDVEKVDFSDASFNLVYGPEKIYLPFKIRLENFIMDRYVNSQSPSSFKSDITLFDEVDGLVMPYSIFMNNVLNYKGYRFFQSSYDNDEKGTILSVNYDPIGTFVSYLGYLLMTIGMFFALFSRKSHFRDLLKRGSKTAVILVLGLFTTFGVTAQANAAESVYPENRIDTEHAERFSRLLIADPRGRIKPVNTLASEVIRKMMRKRTIDGYTSTELFLSMITNQNTWVDVPLIKVSNKEIQERFRFPSKYVSYRQFMDPRKEGLYIINQEVDLAFAKKVTERRKYDKELIKVNERVNIYSQIYYGDLLQIFPLPNDSSKWESTSTLSKKLNPSIRNRINNLYAAYYSNVRLATETGNWTQANIALDSLFAYQLQYAGKSVPSQSKINAEIFYNKVDLFGYASKVYLALGLILLIALFVKIFNPKAKINLLTTLLLWSIILQFVLHTSALGLRWYISGHAPWSNGYETTLFIAWATVLAGIMFAKKSPISLAVTAILSAIFILISSLSWMDPEITNLVPVLKSVWLIIHVAVITSSYGFFALATLLGVLNMIVILMINKGNNIRVTPTLIELSTIIEMAMIIGLYLLTVGTFLGAVWANESWGRYWGWDPKETWALVTVLVYSIVIHLRNVPGMKSPFVVSTGSIIGFASVMMTYFGVNYFLSGMHSYAGGDAFVIPVFVKVIVWAILALVIVAGFKNFNNTKLKENA